MSFRQATAKSTLWSSAERFRLVQRIYPEMEPANIPGITDLDEAQWGSDSELDRGAAIAELLQARLSSSGPVSALCLAGMLGLTPADVEQGLHVLEGEGAILRGQFTPGSSELEWCDRRLLARIHRRTVGRLRKEIQPVSAADFMRFLFEWHRVGTGVGPMGVKGIAWVLDQLQGLEIPAAAWEKFILPARVNDYQSDFLDQLCLSGQFAWARLTPPPQVSKVDADNGKRRVRPTRLAPVAFFRRQNMALLMRLSHGSRTHAEGVQLSPNGEQIKELLEQWGASFFQDLVRLSGRLPIEVETALWELASAGLVTADGFACLRALFDAKQRLRGRRFPKEQRARRQNLSVGRWTLLRPPTLQAGDPFAQRPDLEEFAGILLRRWGVVFRDILQRETLAVRWGDLLRVLRRLEAIGKIRGGRFVAGVAGEQFALPEAVAALRAVRRTSDSGQVIRLSAADPLNLIGLVLPGSKVRPNPEDLLELKAGVPI